MSTPIRTFQVDALPVRVHATTPELADDAAQIARQFLRETLAAQGAAAVILASANSQIDFVEALVRLGGVDWGRVTLFHMDEYLGIDASHPASFRRFMRERVEARVKPRVFHYLAGDAMEPLDECDRYAALLQAQPIDLCCLGIGENGHVAFNDPPVADFADPLKVKLVKLDEICRQQQVNDGCFPNLDSVPQQAITLTCPTLVSGRTLVCVVPGPRKAAAVAATLRGNISTKCPASLLRSHPSATLFVDEAAAATIQT